MRRDSSDIWVVDCSPEGHQPDVSTRIFQGVQQPVCIVLAARAENKNRDVPGRLRYVALPKGKRENKFEVLAELSLADRSWLDGAGGWRDPFLPEQTGAWPSFPALADLFVWSGPGVKTHRTWVISPDILTLENRWTALQREKDPAKKETLFHPEGTRSGVTGMHRSRISSLRCWPISQKSTVSRSRLKTLW
ncbi:MAG: type ISP restriction/modification enzyme, partial [Xanthobacteraceae bacterium]